MKAHGNNHTEACLVCKKELKSKQSLQIHMLQHLKEREKFRCRICNEQFLTKEGLRDHIRRHNIQNTQSYTCTKCMKVFTQDGYLKSHMAKVQRFKCPHCFKVFSNTHNLKDHIKKTHSQHERRYKCVPCDKEYHSIQGYRDHMLAHKGQLKKNCPICQKELNYTNLKRHLDTHKSLDLRKQLKCLICNQLCTNKRNLLHHMLSHRGENTRECPVCNQKVTNLSRHIINAHSKHKISCPICSKQIQKISIDRHMQTHDENRKRYVCTGCDKSFSSEGNLKRHSQSHIGDGMVTCPVCRGKYSPGSLPVHLKNAHGERNSETCTICGGSFLNLSRHLLTHNSVKVKCPTCTKEYKNKYLLSEHMKIHNERKMKIPCNLCDKLFSSRKVLRQHLFTHNAEKVTLLFIFPNFYIINLPTIIAI